MFQNITFKSKPGDLVAVVGSIGTGKSLLLKAISGEMIKEGSGTCYIKGRISYLAEKPWIMNASIEDNILFGNEFHSEKYLKILKITELNTDLKLMENGD